MIKELAENDNLMKKIFRLIRSKSFFIFFGIFLITFLFSYQTANAENIIASFAAGAIRNSVFSVLGLILFFIAWLAGMFLSFGAILLEFVMNPDFFGWDDSLVQDGWAIVRDIANMGFIIALLLISFSTIFGIQSYHAKQLLPRVIAVALTINFSLYFVRIIVGAGDILMIGMLNVQGDNSVGGTLGAIQDLPSYLSMGSGVFDNGFDGVYFPVLLRLIIAIVVFTAMAIAFIVIAFLMIVRLVILMFYAIIAPAAFVATLLPSTRGYTSKWFKEVIRYAFMGPILLFLLLLTLSLSVGFMERMLEESAQAASGVGGGSFWQDLIGNLIGSAFIITCLFFSINIAQKSGFAMADKAFGMQKSVMGWMGKKARQAPGWTGKQVWRRGPNQDGRWTKRSSDFLKKLGDTKGLRSIPGFTSMTVKGAGALRNRRQAAVDNVKNDHKDATTAELETLYKNEMNSKFRDISRLTAFSQMLTDKGVMHKPFKTYGKDEPIKKVKEIEEKRNNALKEEEKLREQAVIYHSQSNLEAEGKALRDAETKQKEAKKLEEKLYNVSGKEISSEYAEMQQQKDEAVRERKVARQSGDTATEKTLTANINELDKKMSGEKERKSKQSRHKQDSAQVSATYVGGASADKLKASRLDQYQLHDASSQEDFIEWAEEKGLLQEVTAPAFNSREFVETMFNGNRSVSQLRTLMDKDTEIRSNTIRTMQQVLRENPKFFDERRKEIEKEFADNIPLMNQKKIALNDMAGLLTEVSGDLSHAYGDPDVLKRIFSTGNAETFKNISLRFQDLVNSNGGDANSVIDHLLENMSQSKAKSIIGSMDDDIGRMFSDRVKARREEEDGKMTAIYRDLFNDVNYQPRGSGMSPADHAGG